MTKIRGLLRFYTYNIDILYMPWKAPVLRKSYKKKYGSRCFLEPKTLKYPICTKGIIDYKALNAAYYYARLNKNKKVLKTIKNLIKKHKTKTKR